MTYTEGEEYQPFYAPFKIVRTHKGARKIHSPHYLPPLVERKEEPEPMVTVNRIYPYIRVDKTSLELDRKIAQNTSLMKRVEADLYEHLNKKKGKRNII